MNINMNIGDAHGGRGRRGSLPPPAAVAITVSSIAVFSIVANPSTDHVPGGGSVTDGLARFDYFRKQREKCLITLDRTTLGMGK